jgi:hypothetical protein
MRAQGMRLPGFDCSCCSSLCSIRCAYLLFPLLYDGLGDAFALLFQLLQRLYALCEHELLGFPAQPVKLTSTAAAACLPACLLACPLS